MEIQTTSLSDVLLICPQAHVDSRGFFVESWQETEYKKIGIPDSPWRQDNVSCSQKGVLRGLHYQFPRGQGKLVTVLAGEIFDVALDIRKGSPTFGKCAYVHLDSTQLKQLWIPKGFAHGFIVLSPQAVVSYKTSEFYHPEDECSILWNDPNLEIPWPLENHPILSKKDEAAKPLNEISPEFLPSYRP